MEAKADDRILTLTRTIATTPEKLFDAWTKPALILQWWGPENAAVAEHVFDVRIGGGWTTTFENSMGGGRNTCSGTYKVIDRPRRLAFTWAWVQPDGTRGHETVVDITFEKVERGTLLTVVQKTFQNSEQRDLHNWGWTSTFNKLERLFTKPPQPEDLS